MDLHAGDFTDMISYDFWENMCINMNKHLHQKEVA